MLLEGADTSSQAPMNPMAIVPSNTAASCKRLVISSRISSITYSEPEALLARQHSLKVKLGRQ